MELNLFDSLFPAMGFVVTSLSLVVLWAGVAQPFRVSLTNPSTLYLPYTYIGNEPQYRYDKGVIEQLAYDASDKLVYAVGKYICVYL